MSEMRHYWVQVCIEVEAQDNEMALLRANVLARACGKYFAHTTGTAYLTDVRTRTDKGNERSVLHRRPWRGGRTRKTEQ